MILSLLAEKHDHMKPAWMIMGILGFFGIVASANPLEVGAKAPEILAVDQDGSQVNFADLYKKGITLVYFYPKADTPGCTAQACSLRDTYTELAQKGVQVIGVSTDTPEDQKKFKEKYHLPFTLIADHDLKVVKAFGVPTLPLKPLAARQAFLIKDGVVVWRDLKASTKQQAQDVLKVLETLK
jgi:thioredoxin-dependent peroxiredoxin